VFAEYIVNYIDPYSQYKYVIIPIHVANMQ
jgi:hypothetical protein